MSFLSKIRGTFETLFRIGKDGPQLKKISTSVLEVRNSADGDYAIVRGATPVGVDDLATKDYTERSENVVIAHRMFT